MYSYPNYPAQAGGATYTTTTSYNPAAYNPPPQVTVVQAAPSYDDSALLTGLAIGAMASPGWGYGYGCGPGWGYGPGWGCGGPMWW